jgi:GMP synthase-like glutamine amidotransferase
MRVLFVQQDHVSPVGPIGAAFDSRGYDVEEFLVVPAESFVAPGVRVTFPDPTQYDAIVPMGAPWSVYDHDRIGSWVHDEITFLRQAVDADVPVLAICFGAQALAAALGGEVVPAGESEVGWTRIQTTRPDLVPEGPWFEWHGDRWQLPAHITAFARTEVAEQAYVTGRCLAVQFHPELTPAMLEGWLAFGGDAHARALGLDPATMMLQTIAEAPAAHARADQLVATFLTQVAPSARPSGS